MKYLAVLLFVGSSIGLFSQQKSYEIPYCEDESEIIRHTGYAAKYKEQYELAEWVVYQLTDEEVEAEMERIGDFREDPKVITGSSSPDDYEEMGDKFHQGHLAPAEDMEWLEEAMRDSFYMTNIAPQRSGFNLGIWKRLENRVRKWAQANDEVYVVAGPILTYKIDDWIGENRVAVPKRFYKVILDLKEPELKAIGFIIPNKNDDHAVCCFTVPVDKVEHETGIDFFYLVDDEIEERLESTIDTMTLWEW